MKIKINGKEVEVQEGTEVEVKPTTTPEAPAEDKALMDKAKELGKIMAKEFEDRSGIVNDPDLKRKVDKMVEFHYGSDSKLKQILNGKDLFAVDQLTKEEKILGFYHALVTRNHVALKALAEGTDADGGYLFPNEFLAEVIRDLPELNVMRQYVRVIPMKRDKMDITSLVDGVDVFWTAENAAKSTTTARFTSQTLTAFKLAAILYASDELIEDSTEIDVVSMIIQLFSEAIAEEEQRAIWQGNGTTQPQGINTATVASIGGTGNAYNDLVNLYWLLPQKYHPNAAWFMNAQTANQIQLVKDTQGRPLFNAATDALDSTIMGKPVVIVDDVPGRVVYFGDLKRGYFLGDRKRMTAKVSNDTETAFTKDQTAIRVVARIAGRLVLPAAVRKVTSF